jgi:hypothetical protein
VADKPDVWSVWAGRNHRYLLVPRAGSLTYAVVELVLESLLVVTVAQAVPFHRCSATVEPACPGLIVVENVTYPP